MSEFSIIPSRMKPSEFKLDEWIKIGASVGPLFAKCIRRDVAGDLFHFRWRFEGDEAAGVVNVRDDEDVIGKIIDLASDIYQNTGRRQQPGVPVPSPTLTIKEFDRMLREWSAEMLKDYNKHAMKPGGPVPTPYPGLEAWLPVEDDPQRVNWERMTLGRPVSKAQDDMRRRGEENKRRGILKHGPYGSGEAGDCDADCAKCKAEQRAPQPAIDRYTDEQRRDGNQVYAPPRISAADRAVASAEWSRQLREKVDAAKKRDAEKARETHYWDPEGGE